MELRSCKHNLLSADQYPVVVDEYLANEVMLDRIAEVIQPVVQAKLHLNPFGVIPKKQTGQLLSTYQHQREQV